MATGDIYEVRLEGRTVSETRWNQVLRFRLEVESATDLFATSGELALDVGNSWGVNYMDSASDETFLDSVRATRIWPDPGIPAVRSDILSKQGQTPSPSATPDTAMVMTFRTGEPGRRFLGRSFLAGLPAANIVGDLWDDLVASELADELENQMTLQFTDGAQNEWVGVVFSRTQANAGLTPVSARINNVLADRVTRNQTRRGVPFRIPATDI